MKLAKILCPVDFSPRSHHAMLTAIRIENATDAELVLAHAWQPPAMMYAGDAIFPVDIVQSMLDDERRGLEDAVREAKELRARHVTSSFLTGVPWREVVDTLDKDADFDLVVMSTHGRSGIPRVLLGSVAEKVVRHAPCSVLTVHEDDKADTFQSVLCPVDFSQRSQQAIDLAATFVEPGGTGITLLHVLELPVTYSGEPSIAGFMESLDKRAARRLEDLAARLRETVAVPVVTRSRIGSPGGQTLAFLDEKPPTDLVVIGSHGRTGISRALLGSVAEKIVRYARCAVLVARQRAPV